MRRTATLAALSTAAATVALGAGSATAATPGPLPAGTIPVNILNMNDFHGRIDTDGKGTLGKAFACTILTQRAALGAANTLTLGAGDLIGASPFTSAVQDDNPTIDYLNAIGLQASSVGNHEFDKGFGDLTGRVIPRAQFQYVGSNVLNASDGSNALAPYTTFDVAGVKVAVIGGVTKDTPNLVAGSGVAGLTFDDPVAGVNRTADALTDGNAANGEADVLVAEYHEGGPFSTTSSTTTTTGQLADQLGNPVFAHLVNDTSPKVAAILQGHTHQAYVYDVQIPGAPAGSTRPVLQTGNYAAAVGKIQLGYDPVTRSVTAYQAANIPAAAPTAGCLADAQYQNAASIIDAAVNYAKPLAAKQIGSVTADITRGKTAGGAEDRMVESTLSNLIAQQYVESVNGTGRMHADLGLMNPGGVRADLLYTTSTTSGGVVTFSQAATIMPFGNTVKTAQYTGAQIKAILEEQWQPATASRPFLALGSSNNVRWTFDPTAASGSRITSVWVDNAPIDMTRLYTVASNSFLITQVGAPPDNFGTFQKGINYADSGLVDQNAFMDWIAANSPLTPDFRKHGVAVIGAGPYRIDTQGSFTVDGLDMTVLNAPANATVDVWLGTKFVGTFPVSTTVTTTPVPRRIGSAQVSFWVKGVYLNDAIRASGTPLGSKSAPLTLRIVANPTGTVITLPVTITRLNP